jgi:hypothetical protein
VQQPAALQVDLPAQVEVDVAGLRGGRQPQPPLRCGHVAGDRHAGGLPRHAAEALADDKPALDQLEPQRVALAQHGERGVGDLGQAGDGPTAQRRERVGQPGRLDDVGAGDR